MIDTLKKLLLTECRSTLTNLDEEMKQLQNKKIELDKKSKDYRDHRSNPGLDSRTREFINNYSKISKFFNRNKYNAELNKLYRTIVDEYQEKINEAENERKEILERNNEIEREITLASEKAQMIDAATTIGELNITFDEAKELLSKNNINIFNYSVKEILSLGYSNETTRNIDFMRKAVEKDPYNIIFDQTLDFGMYYELIKGLEFDSTKTSELDLLNKEAFYEDKKSILDILEKSMSGLTHIKPLYLLEVIRFYFKDTIMYEKGGINEGEKQEMLGAVLSYINRVINMAQKLSIEDYVELESMYNPEENDYYCHRTGAFGIENAIFQEGLKISMQNSDPIKLIVRNARKIDCFLAIAGYCNFYAGDGRGESRMILEVPKGCERPIGADSIDGQTYVLPEYVIASLYEHTTYDEYGSPIKRENPVLHINNQNKKKYRYLFRDGYDARNPLPIENPEFEIENVEGNKK